MSLNKDVQRYHFLQMLDFMVRKSSSQIGKAVNSGSPFTNAVFIEDCFFKVHFQYRRN